MTPFIIYALPRSRTFWVSRFLSYGDWNCGHDELRHARGLEDVRSWLSQECTGTVETAGAPWWRLARRYRPDLRTIVIRRPVRDVVESLVRLGLDTTIEPLMVKLDRKLDQIERRVPGVLSISYAELATEAGCARLFEHCLPYAHKPDWWGAFASLNLQVSMAALIRYSAAYQTQLDKVAKIAKQQCIAGMARPVKDLEGVSIQQESFETVHRDGRHLFRDHCISVGETPDSWEGKNIPLMRELDRRHAIQFMTARSNGRMFGYLMAILSPSLESPHIMTAVHTLFFAAPGFFGLGMKMQRASIAALKEKGIHEVYFRAGPRGSGPKMGPLYQRLGAEDFGHLYKLETGAV